MIRKDATWRFSFFSVLKQHPQQMGGDDMLCAVDEWRLEGKREGKMENSISIINNMKNMGIDWGLFLKQQGLIRNNINKCRLNISNLLHSILFLWKRINRVL